MTNTILEKPKVKYFSSQDAAKILGVNVSTIKRWTEEGKLDCIASAGGHRKFLFKHLADYLEANKTKGASVNLFPVESKKDLEITHRIMQRDFDFLSDTILKAAFESQRESILRVLNGLYLSQIPLYEIYDHVIVPVLQRIGEMWMHRTISIGMEHLASQCLKDAIIRLQGTIRVPADKKGKALCLTLSNELHDISLKMVDHILEMRGFKVLFSGQMTPTENMDRVFEQFRPDRVYVSSTIITDRDYSQTEIEVYERLCTTYGATLYIGGTGFDKLECGAVRLRSFSEVAAI